MMSLIMSLVFVVVMQKQEADYIAGYSLTFKEDDTTFIVEAEDCIEMMSYLFYYGTENRRERYNMGGEACTAMWNYQYERQLDEIPSEDGGYQAGLLSNSVNK